MLRTRRTFAVIVGVLLLHLLLLWTMRTDVMHRAAEAMVPAEIVLEVKATPHAARELSTGSIRAPEPSQQVAQVSASKVQDKTQEAQPVQRAEWSAVSQENAHNASTEAPSTNAAGYTGAALGAATTSLAAATLPSATLDVELPSKDAAYLNNPKPPYPKRSWQLHEQGKVVVRVWIGTDGQATQASVTSSSGFQRLDMAAVNAALAWRYVPGKRGGVAEAMWFDIPVDWVLQ